MADCIGGGEFRAGEQDWCGFIGPWGTAGLGRNGWSASKAEMYVLFLQTQAECLRAQGRFSRRGVEEGAWYMYFES
jgi:hypothetical protein